MENLVEELKSKIIEMLNLEDMTPAEIENDQPLFGTGLGLDSIDALELIVLLDKDYGIKFVDQREGMQAFGSMNIMAAYIAKNRTK